MRDKTEVYLFTSSVIVIYIIVGILINKRKKKHNLQEFYLKEIKGARK
jgi:hypothetical protein